MDQWELSKDGELEGQWRIWREEVGGKEQQVRGDSKRRPKRTQNRLFKYLYIYVGTLRLGYGECDITSETTLHKRNKKLTDENPVNEGLDMYKSTDEALMIPSVF